MARVISKKQRRSLIEDVIQASHDVEGLAKKHEMSPAELAAWIGEEETRRTLVGLCDLASLQTRLLMSRYQALAADRLARLVTDGDSAPESARKACLDLLGHGKGFSESGKGRGGVRKDVEATPAEDLRTLLYEREGREGGSDEGGRGVA